MSKRTAIIAFALGALLGSPLVALAEGSWKSVVIPLEWGPTRESGRVRFAEAPLFSGAELRRHDGVSAPIHGMTIAAHGYGCRASVVGDELSLVLLKDKPDGSGPLGLYEARRYANGQVSAWGAISTPDEAPAGGKDM
jgi:hypothetical protein